MAMPGYLRHQRYGLDGQEWILRSQRCMPTPRRRTFQVASSSSHLSPLCRDHCHQSLYLRPGLKTAQMSNNADQPLSAQTSDSLHLVSDCMLCGSGALWEGWQHLTPIGDVSHSRLPTSFFLWISVYVKHRGILAMQSACDGNAGQRKVLRCSSNA